MFCKTLSFCFKEQTELNKYRSLHKWKVKDSGKPIKKEQKTGINPNLSFTWNIELTVHLEVWKVPLKVIVCCYTAKVLIKTSATQYQNNFKRHVKLVFYKHQPKQRQGLRIISTINNNCNTYIRPLSQWNFSLFFTIFL